MTQRTAWIASIVVTVVLLGILGWQWAGAGDYQPFAEQLPDQAAALEFLADEAGKTFDQAAGCEGRAAEAAGNGPALVPSGVFVESLRFENATEVHMTGYLWQVLDERLQAERAAGTFREGFVLPEQIDASGSPLEEAYRVTSADQCGLVEETVGWRFEATLRQQFEFADYPFDDKTAWLRLLPMDFARDIVLFPDYASYVSTRAEDEFGIEEEIVLGEWEIAESYFDYRLYRDRDSGTLFEYDTNFGIQDYIGRAGFPEMRYNVVLIREFENAFIVNLVPLLIVAALAFAALLTVTYDESSAGVHGFNTSGVVAGVSALFFVVVVAHVQLRQEFSGAGLVYLEMFFFLMYGVLLLVAVDSYLVSVRNRNRVLSYGDNLIPKTLFWPLILLAMVIITAVML